MSPSIRQLAPVILTCLATVLGGCSLLPDRQATQQVTEYRIAPPLPGPVAWHDEARCPDLRVATPTAAPGFEGTGMRYSTAPYQIADFAYHRWIAPPAAMLAMPLSEALRASGNFKHVIGGTTPSVTPLSIATHLVTLLQVFHGDHSRIHLIVDTTLNDTRNDHTLATRRFDIKEDVSAPNPVAGVTATNLAVEQWTRAVNHWLNRRVDTGLCNSPQYGARTAGAGNPQ
ncbi:hypothetical protein BI364_05360 [Acidihalobacter yilgarnensis]|uniref:ABC-type transport auxiliary lipoprotein component domain-containing protein n=1 Tax=Acidihalobacter yilgarnensis TaxID=2819280 RepID=A0A1D8ILY5_9GAMM|nr:ABC-type transport auxiliary lipoprotein family protein [Acidihalobacter yilgarnensis]AOU97476.1 hypothetical protein BI364_05360 [Acidihalobacter yilgarnensis]